MHYIVRNIDGFFFVFFFQCYDVDGVLLKSISPHVYSCNAIYYYQNTNCPCWLFQEAENYRE